MTREELILGIFLLTLPLTSGCWFLAGAAAGGVTALEVRSDSATANFDASFEKAYEVSLDIMQTIGRTSLESERKGWIKTTTPDKYEVAVRIEQLTTKAVKITVSARKYTTPKVQFAKDTLNQIAQRLK